MQQTLKTLVPKTEKAAMVLRALNHKLRQQIIEYLLSHPGTNVTTLYQHFHLEQTVASQHLSILRNGGIVTTKREGKQILYSVDQKRLALVELVTDQLLSKNAA